VTDEYRVALRQARTADREYCFQLHRSALGEYVEAIWGWDEAAQRERHEDNFERDRTQIITVNGHDAGSLNVDEGDGEVALGRIELEPEYQGRGIGGHIVRALITEAASRGEDVVLEVLDVNTRAKVFYERLGFVETGRPKAHKIRMRYTAP
jgi:putative acetyltransferase